MCHATVLGVLRSKLRLYRTIDILADGKKIDPEIRTILAISLYQLTELDRVPARAIVYDAVNLAIHARKKSAKGFVNALLRKFQMAAPMPDYEDEMERLSIETSHPDWLLRRWIANFGEERARELAVFNNQPAANDYRFTCRTTAADRTAIECVEPSLRPHLLRELADSGKIYFQDRGSQLVASAIRPKPGQRLLDVCAAPGGKATLVAFETKADANLIVAGDVSQSRVRTLAAICKQQAARKVRVAAFDARQLPFADESFDIVFVDAPCSGTGTIRHNPEIRYLISEEQFVRYSEKQLSILRSASNAVKRGGLLIYATCSLEPEENEQVCDRFIDGNGRFSPGKLEFPELFALGSGRYRTIPGRDAMDGFFVSAFEKL